MADVGRRSCCLVDGSIVAVGMFVKVNREAILIGQELGRLSRNRLASYEGLLKVDAAKIGHRWKD